jgi:hypothetical protein
MKLTSRGWATQKAVLIRVLLVAAGCHLLAGVAAPLNLGTGEPGLKIDYKSTNRFVIYLDEPGTVGPGFMGGYDTRHIDVLLDRNYGLKEMIQTRKWDGDPQQLYPFDEQTAFTCEGQAKPPDNQIYTTNRMGGYVSADGKFMYFPRVTQVFATNANSILVSDDVYALARTRYGLTTNQWFLGNIGTNIYYWEIRYPTKVYVRGLQETKAANYFELRKGVFDVIGATKAVNSGKDIGFVIWRKSTGFFPYSPNTSDFIEVSFKDAKRVAGEP